MKLLLDQNLSRKIIGADVVSLLINSSETIRSFIDDDEKSILAVP